MQYFQVEKNCQDGPNCGGSSHWKSVAFVLIVSVVTMMTLALKVGRAAIALPKSVAPFFLADFNSLLGCPVHFDITPPFIWHDLCHYEFLWVLFGNMVGFSAVATKFGDSGDFDEIWLNTIGYCCHAVYVV